MNFSVKGGPRMALFKKSSKINLKELEILISIPEIEDNVYHLLEFYKLKFKNEIKNLQLQHEAAGDKLIPLLSNNLLPSTAPDKLKKMNSILLCNPEIMNAVLDDFFLVIMPNIISSKIEVKEETAI